MSCRRRRKPTVDIWELRVNLAPRLGWRELLRESTNICQKESSYSEKINPNDHRKIGFRPSLLLSGLQGSATQGIRTGRMVVTGLASTGPYVLNLPDLQEAFLLLN